MSTVASELPQDGIPTTDPSVLTRAQAWRVVLASSLGTMFEWYDFFIFGSLLSIINRHFFADAGETQGYIFALLTFAVGFAVRPFGGLVFGYFGDRTGRKRTFLFTITLSRLIEWLHEKVDCIPKQILRRSRDRSR